MDRQPAGTSAGLRKPFWNNGKMFKVLLIATAALVVVALGGAVFLMFWDIPAPSARVERVIPDARFPK